MTEQEWLTGTDAWGMLQHLRGRASDRKLLLFAAAGAAQKPPAEYRQAAARLAAAAEAETPTAARASPAWDVAFAWSVDRVPACARLRCLFGNPFCPVSLDPTWCPPTVFQLAQTAYAERPLPSGHLDLACLAVLADALEAAGATGEIVAHLRSPGPHVRGCWTVDLLLGKG